MANRFAFALAIILAVVSHTAQASELTSNPFAAPADIDPQGAGREGDIDQPAVMELHGTLVAGAYSLADIGGEILSVGDEINGYRLLEVRERHVVLGKGQVQTTMWVGGEDGRPE